jgi:hypothetical protein
MLLVCIYSNSSFQTLFQAKSKPKKKQVPCHLPFCWGPMSTEMGTKKKKKEIERNREQNWVWDPF